MRCVVVAVLQEAVRHERRERRRADQRGGIPLSDEGDRRRGERRHRCDDVRFDGHPQLPRLRRVHRHPRGRRPFSPAHSVRIMAVVSRPSPFVPVRRRPECSDLFRDTDTMGIGRSGWITSERLYLSFLVAVQRPLFAKRMRRLTERRSSFLLSVQPTRLALFDVYVSAHSFRPECASFTIFEIFGSYSETIDLTYLGTCCSTLSSFQ